jgi:RNA polymerase sigma-70 factor (sigma-E family)
MTPERDERFRRFVTEQWGPLARTAFLLTGDRGAAEDLVQSALEKAHRRWDQILRQDAPEVYVHRIMVNTLVSWRRRRRVAEVELVAATMTQAPDEYGRADTRHQLISALRTLPPRTRVILVLRYFEDRSEADVAEILGCSVGSVKSQASRGLAKLRAGLDARHPSPIKPISERAAR